MLSFALALRLPPLCRDELFALFDDEGDVRAMRDRESVPLELLIVEWSEPDLPIWSDLPGMLPELPCMLAELPCMPPELPCMDPELPCIEPELPCMFELLDPDAAD